MANLSSIIVGNYGDPMFEFDLLLHNCQLKLYYFYNLENHLLNGAHKTILHFYIA